jgi:hypothetical protein
MDGKDGNDNKGRREKKDVEWTGMVGNGRKWT